jgi:hypothetical protein
MAVFQRYINPWQLKLWNVKFKENFEGRQQSEDTAHSTLESSSVTKKMKTHEDPVFFSTRSILIGSSGESGKAAILCYWLPLLEESPFIGRCEARHQTTSHPTRPISSDINL